MAEFCCGMEIFKKKNTCIFTLWNKIVIQGGKMMGTMCFCVCVLRKFLQLSMSFPQLTLRMLRDLPRLLREAMNGAKGIYRRTPLHILVLSGTVPPLNMFFFENPIAGIVTHRGFSPLFSFPIYWGFQKVSRSQKKS